VHPITRMIAKHTIYIKAFLQIRVMIYFFSFLLETLLHPITRMIAKHTIYIKGIFTNSSNENFLVLKFVRNPYA
jgi:hypothetical protein